MQYDEALQLFAKHEHENEPLPQQDGGTRRRGDSTTDSSSPRDRMARGAVWRSETLPQKHAHQKYGYVISCQIYGAYTREKPGTPRHAKVQQIKDLLRLFPHLRIAYTDESEDKRKHYSCLMRWDAPSNDTVEIYRVELPGHMLVGEGKPENQNHAIIFTRGETIQTLDMNQDGYFEEALKMRNLLREFDKDRVAIIGFPEHQFTEALSATAEFAALTEFTFATLIQRTLGSPFDVRMHYGHPDVFCRLFHVTRGGISKANKVLCVSEDIFGAFNSVLKGGRVIYREYIKAGKGKDLGFEQVYLFESKISSGNGEQALSRDFSRLTDQFDLPRLLSFFHSSNGFYWSNMFVIWSTSWFVYTQLLISICIPDEESALLSDLTKAVTFSVQLGIILTVPLVAELILEKGFGAATYQMLRVLGTGGPLFFMFHIRTKSYFYDITITLGGAKYMPTGRGFVLGHTNFVKLFRMFCNSHFNYGFTLTLNLLVYWQFIVDQSQYLAVSWATWLFALDLLYAPFIFNCLAFDRTEVEKDLNAWRKFIGRNDLVDPNMSWRAHWEDANSIYNNLSTTQKANLICRNLFWLILALAIIVENLGSSTEHLWIVPAIVLFGVMVNLCVTRNSVSFMGLGCFQQGLKSRRVRRIAVLFSCAVIVTAVYVLFQKYSHPVDLLFEYFAAAGYVYAFVVNTLYYMGYRSEFIYSSYWMWDFVLGYVLIAPFYIMSYLGACSDAHMRLLYNMTFVVGLKMQTLMEKTNISQRLSDLEKGVKLSKERIIQQSETLRLSSQLMSPGAPLLVYHMLSWPTTCQRRDITS
jgi:callose synthase